MALDGATGTIKWQWKGDGPAYASPVIGSFGSSRQVITQSRTHVVGISAANGALLWSVPFTTAYDQNIVTPIVSGDLVLYSGIEQPLTALRIRESAGKWTAERAWRAESVPMYMSTAVLSGGTAVRPDAPEQGPVLCRRSALRQGAVDDEGTRGGERGADCRGRAADGDHHGRRAGDRAPRRGEVRRDQALHHRRISGVGAPGACGPRRPHQGCGETGVLGRFELAITCYVLEGCGATCE